MSSHTTSSSGNSWLKISPASSWSSPSRRPGQRSWRCTSSGSTTQPVAGIKPYEPSRLGRPRHLHPRGLLQLPLADGAAVRAPRRCATRATTRGRRVRLRPTSFSVGSKRTGPTGARGGALFGRVAPGALQHTRATSVPESNMPAYPWLAASSVEGVDVAGAHARAGQAGRAYTASRSPRRRRAQGQTNSDALNRLPAGAGRRDAQRRGTGG